MTLKIFYHLAYKHAENRSAAQIWGVEDKRTCEISTS